jgi:hypothetical protein
LLGRNSENRHLCLAGSFVRTRESLHVVFDVALVPQELNICTILQHTAFLLQLDVLLASEWCESPVLADNDLLATRELVHRSSKSLDGGSTVSITSSDGQENLANVDTSNRSVGLAPRSSHSSLQSIGTSARQHLVDSDDMVWVGTHTKVETFLASNLDEVPAVHVRLVSFSLNFMV